MLALTSAEFIKWDLSAVRDLVKVAENVFDLVNLLSKVD